MKKFKILLPLLLLALSVALAGCADAGDAASEPEMYRLEGTVVDITEEGILLETTDFGEVIVLSAEDTVIDSLSPFAAGDYLFIDYNGQMTRSIPAQVTALAIRMYTLDGTVSEIYADENAVLLTTPTHGEVYVTLPEEYADADLTELDIRVYFDGAMTMSIPPQVNAAHIVPVYTLQGAVLEIGKDYILISQDEGPDVEVHFSEGMLPETVEVGAVVQVKYNGMMTFSLPAQISAMEIVQLSK